MDTRSDMKIDWRKFAFVFVFVAGLLFSTQASASQPPWVTGESRPEDLSIKLVTFSPGDEIVAWFGHTALVVEDERLDRARLYNYGMFSFGDDMLVKFAMGRLWFWVGQAPVYRTYEFYKHMDRDVRILELNLEPEDRLEMAKALAHDVLPENRDYLYHHYFNNCSTKIRDAIDKAVDGQLKEATSHPSDQTFRGHTRRHSAHNPPMEMLLMFLMNDDIDQPIERWDDMFLPEELEEAVENLEYKNSKGEVVPLVVEKEIYYESDRERVPQKAPTRWPWALAVGLLLGGTAVLLGKWYFDNRSKVARIGFGLYNALIGLVVGIPGLALFIMWAITDHKVTYANENLFLGNPLTLLAAPLGVALAFGSTRVENVLRFLWAGLAALGLAMLPLKLLPMFDQNNLLPALMLLPILLGFGAVWWVWGGSSEE
ncbi:DUF4105 domain-containing protein [Persicimonas caeni]|uniref:DUF4105 domain-containing protein n=2 Tax=Persicimonas caeni TaxID=2292766 RepID=A0A4Y6PYX2_PERCE|nr:DUF4105 domain-containing protein [Persicimonas caeni]QDG53359.1 DUF4105 domain-containing protein [Persicimonas caeni]QED34580.1 DUF4105 domain-containing protein [Persicimonas caeni]